MFSLSFIHLLKKDLFDLNKLILLKHIFCNLPTYHLINDFVGKLVGWWVGELVGRLQKKFLFIKY